MSNNPIPEISAERFSYELYEPNFWQRLGFEFSTSYVGVFPKYGCDAMVIKATTC